MWTKGPLIVGIALSVSSIAAPVATPAGELAADEWQEIAAIPDVFVERALAGDWDAVADLYHEEAVQMLPDALPSEGRDAIRGALARMLGAAGRVRLTGFAVDIHESELLGETVYVLASYRFEGEALAGAEGSFQQHGPYLNILRQDMKGTWLIWRQFVGRAHPAGAQAEE